MKGPFALLALLFYVGSHKYNNTEWHSRFVYFIAALPLNTGKIDSELKEMEKFISYGGAYDPWLLAFYNQINRLKCYEQMLRVNPTKFDEILSVIQSEFDKCKSFPDYPRAYLLMWLVKLIDACKSTPGPMPLLYFQLLEQITLKDCKNSDALDLYYESRENLAIACFAYPYSTLEDKLNGLKNAMRYALQYWLHQPESESVRTLITNIALAILLANEQNLLATPGFANNAGDLAWLNQKLKGVVNRLPIIFSHDEQEKFIEHVLLGLITQRDLVIPVQNELTSIREELAAEKQENLIIKERLRQLESQVAQLVAVAAKAEIKVPTNDNASSSTRQTLW